MRSLYLAAADEMDAAFRSLEDQVPRPRVVRFRDGDAVRYLEKSPQQALIQKLARHISGLRALDLLLSNGFVQEQAVIQRTLDEISEDILFLVLGIGGGLTRTHRRYLKVFWREEFEDGAEPLEDTRGRYNVPRGEIREYIARVTGSQPGGKEDRVSAILTRAYSGYVHAASPHVMEMCGGPEMRFYTSGLRDTSRVSSHARDAWNYFYRGLISATYVAEAFGSRAVADRLQAAILSFERQSGSEYMLRASSGTAPR